MTAFNRTITSLIITLTLVAGFFVPSYAASGKATEIIKTDGVEVVSGNEDSSDDVEVVEEQEDESSSSDYVCVEHDWSSWTVTKEPTAFTKGSKTRVCSICGEKEKRSIKKKRVISRWVKYKDERYYFNKNGDMAKDGWKKIRSTNKDNAVIKWCYFNKDGEWQKSISKSTRNKWVRVNGKKFYFTSKMRPASEGFLFINKDLFYFDTDNSLVIGKFKVGKTNYKTDSRGRIRGYQYYKIKYGSFIYIDISDQKLYCCKKGNTILKANVVTGKPGTATPTGDYSIRSKSRNVSLIGSTWNVMVSYWMAFIGSSYGLHDASWRSNAEFANKKTYLRNGSHGCVNMKKKDVKVIFDNIKVGTKVLIRK